MTKQEFEAMDFDVFMEWAYEYLDDVTTVDTLIEYAICKIKDDDIGMALHVLNAVYDNPYDTEWYRYDYCMGKLETPTPITEKADLEDLMFFEDEEVSTNDC